jgi:DNA-binding response OmpR family regulator
MPRLLIVEDDESMRELLREALRGSYEIVATGDAAQALALALDHRPDAILLDLTLPDSSGFELCQTFCSLNATRQVPIFVITGKPAAEYKEFCLNLGATEYVEKPVDLARLRGLLEGALGARKADRRQHPRVRLAVALKLRGNDVLGNPFDILTASEDVSAGGFLANCAVALEKNAQVEVFLKGTEERYAGRARVVRVEERDTPRQRYGFQFVENPRQWILPPA